MVMIQPFNRLRTLLFGARLRLRGSPPGRRFFIHGGFPRLAGRGRIVIGERVNWSCHNAPVDIEIGKGGLLEVGARAFLNAGVEIVCHQWIRIGEHCRIGPRCVLVDTNHHPVHEGQQTRVAPIKLGRNVWLGRGVIVLPGVNIGDNSVVAAGSVVFTDVPAGEVWRGNPAQYVKPVRASHGYVRP
jgi:acetyltransferase-like isoleucine patch superfamily enzyme